MTYTRLLILFSFFIVSATATAQYGNPYGYGSQLGGVDRSISRQQYKNPKKKVEKKDLAESGVEFLDEKLKLDDFQKAVIANIYKEHEEALLSIDKLELPLPAKKDRVREILEKIDAKILPILGKEQTEAYKKTIDDRKF